MKKQNPFDILNKKFGRLLVIEILPTIRSGTKYIRRAKCKCDCGNEKEIRIDRIKSGDSKSCGCLNKELMDQRRVKHGYCDHPLYSIWEGIKDRCYNPNRKYYYVYGGKGIRVSDEWREHPDEFIKWALENGYAPGLQLDRRDNDGDYSPTNCRFVTPIENTNNRSVSIHIVHEGEIHTLMEWSRIKNIPYQTLRKRYKEENYSIDRLFDPISPNNSKRNHWRRILIMNIDNQPLMIVSSIKIASIVSKCHSSNIFKQMKGKLNQIKGFKFKYA